MLIILTFIMYFFFSHKIAIILFIFIGVVESILARIKGEITFNNNLKYLSLIMLMIPSGIFLIFNNNTQGLYFGIFLLLIISFVRIYFSLKKPSSEIRKKKIKIFNLLYSLSTVVIILINVYFLNFYNHTNSILWKNSLDGALTSKIRISDSTLSFLVNNDYLRRGDYNFPQTFNLNLKDGNVITSKGGYQFNEDFKPYNGITNNVIYKDIKIVPKDNIIYIKSLDNKKIITKFIANGKILVTPQINKGILYFIANDWSLLDKRRKIKVYSLNISKLL